MANNSKRVIIVCSWIFWPREQNLFETKKMTTADVAVVRSVYTNSPWLSHPSAVNGVRKLQDNHNIAAIFFFFSPPHFYYF